MNTRGLRVLLLALLCACAAAFGQTADEPARRAALARELLALPQAAAGVAQLEVALADVLARPVLRNLRPGEGWGPNHPLWAKTFPAFRTALLEQAKQLAPDLRGDVARALADKLSAQELGEVLAVQRDPRLAQLVAALGDIGLDPLTLVRIAGMSRAPEFYSQAEQQAMAQQLLGLNARQQELVRQHQELEPMLQALRQPAMLKFQAAVSGVLSDALKRVEADAGARQDAAAFLAAWRDRLKDD